VKRQRYAAARCRCRAAQEAGREARVFTERLLMRERWREDSSLRTAPPADGSQPPQASSEESRARSAE